MGCAASVPFVPDEACFQLDASKSIDGSRPSMSPSDRVPDEADMLERRVGSLDADAEEVRVLLLPGAPSAPVSPEEQDEVSLP